MIKIPTTENIFSKYEKREIISTNNLFGNFLVEKGLYDEIEITYENVNQLRYYQRVPIPPVSSLVRTLSSALPPFPLDTESPSAVMAKSLRNCILSAGYSIVKVHGRKISPHPVFHTFFAIYQVEPLEFTKNS